MLPMAVVVTIGLSSNDNALAQSPLAPVMNEELMARLIKYTQDLPRPRSITANLCKVLKLCDGTKALPLKITQLTVGNEIHLFGMPLEADSKDIVIMVTNPNTVSAYLTDRTGKLRAAAITEKNGARLIANEGAAENFKAELVLFAKKAAELPPTK